MVTTKDFCVEHSESCVTDAYLAGYKQAIEDAAALCLERAMRYFSAMEGEGEPDFSKFEFASTALGIFARDIAKLAGREDS
jgi:hypothetical protein